MKKIILYIILLSCGNVFPQTSKEIMKEIKSNAVLHDLNQNLSNHVKIKEIVKVGNFNEEITLLNNYNLSDFWPINFNFIGKINDVFSEILVFFPQGFKSKHEVIYFNDLSKKIQNIFSFKKEEKEYYIIEYKDFITYESKFYNRDYKDKFLVIEKNELLELIQKLKQLENEITTFKNNIEKSKFKLLILQQKEVVRLNDYGNYISKKRQFMTVFLSSNNYDSNNPFDFSKSIKINDFNFNIDYKEIIDIDGKDLSIDKIKAFKDNNGNLKAKVSVGLNNLKILKINYSKLQENYFADWKGNFPNSDSDSFYYFLESKNSNDLNVMNKDGYWEKIFNDEMKFKSVLDNSDLKIDDILIDTNLDFNKIFAFPKLDFKNNEIYESQEYMDEKTNITLTIQEFQTNYSGGFFPNEMLHSLTSKLKRETRDLYNEKSKEINRVQGNKKVIADMTKKYGKKYVDDALNGNITIGMPEELLPIPLQAWVIKSRDEYPNGYKLYCSFGLNTDRKLLITVINKKVFKISNW
ncbi:hypothetical protein [Flavobacterium sp.]|jgi:hypothetical protein|uniref:hypothetical protein n=1 Tax=Flavobacterium sp. TaxID=239 RepID=UPI0037BEBF17